MHQETGVYFTFEQHVLDTLAVPPQLETYVCHCKSINKK